MWDGLQPVFHIKYRNSVLARERHVQPRRLAIQKNCQRLPPDPHSSVGRERDAEKRGGLLDRLRDRSAFDVDDLQALRLPSAEDDDDMLAVGRERHREREIADRDRPAGRIERRAGRKLTRGGGEREQELKNERDTKP